MYLARLVQGRLKLPVAPAAGLSKQKHLLVLSREYGNTIPIYSLYTIFPFSLVRTSKLSKQKYAVDWIWPVAVENAELYALGLCVFSDFGSPKLWSPGKQF